MLEFDINVSEAGSPKHKRLHERERAAQSSTKKFKKANTASSVAPEAVVASDDPKSSRFSYDINIKFLPFIEKSYKLFLTDKTTMGTSESSACQNETADSVSEQETLQKSSAGWF